MYFVPIISASKKVVSVGWSSVSPVTSLKVRNDRVARAAKYANLESANSHRDKTLLYQRA